jgi:hypothetical protein
MADDSSYYSYGYTDYYDYSSGVDTAEVNATKDKARGEAGDEAGDSYSYAYQATTSLDDSASKEGGTAQALDDGSSSYYSYGYADYYEYYAEDSSAKGAYTYLLEADASTDDADLNPAAESVDIIDVADASKAAQSSNSGDRVAVEEADSSDLSLAEVAMRDNSSGTGGADAEVLASDNSSDTGAADAPLSAQMMVSGGNRSKVEDADAILLAQMMASGNASDAGAMDPSLLAAMMADGKEQEMSSLFQPCDVDDPCTPFPPYFLSQWCGCCVAWS